MSKHHPLLPATIPASGGALTPSSSTQRIATRMAENLLTQARSQEWALAVQRRYQIDANKRVNLKLDQLNGGLDPEMLAWATELAVFHIEAGTRKFSDYARTMMEDIGDDVKPYLLCFWEAARHYPGLDVAGMTSPEDSASEHQVLFSRTDASTQTTGMECYNSSEKMSPTKFAGSIEFDALFDGDAGLSSGLNFDEKTYSKAKPLFQQTIANLGNTSSDLKDVMRAVVQMMVDRIGAAAAQQMKPYAVRFIREQLCGVESSY